MIKSNFSLNQVDSNDLNSNIILEDLGPWNIFKTITNDAENVILYLGDRGLAEYQRVFYYDSEGELGELLHENGKFIGFGHIKNIEEIVNTK